MKRTLRPLAAFAMVALINVISAGCGSTAPSETGAASNTGTASNKRATDQDKIASPSSAGSSSSVGSSPSPAGLPRSVGSPPSPAGLPPSPAGRLPYAGSKDAAVASTLGIGAGVNAITALGEKG
jgi:hypothetical protein